MRIWEKILIASHYFFFFDRDWGREIAEGTARPQKGIGMDDRRHQRYKALNMHAQDLDGGELQTRNSTPMPSKSSTVGSDKERSSQTA